MAPSMLCQRHAMPSIWSYSASPAFQIAWNTPAFSHSRNRLWTALALPNRSLGKAFHWQPVLSTYITASNTCRAGLGGRPAPGLRKYSLPAGRSRIGISGSTRCQKSSVTTHESTRFLVVKVLPYAASTTAQGDSLLFTDKLLSSSISETAPASYGRAVKPGKVAKEQTMSVLTRVRFCPSKGQVARSVSSVQAAIFPRAARLRVKRKSYSGNRAKFWTSFGSTVGRTSKRCNRAGLTCRIALGDPDSSKT